LKEPRLERLSFLAAETTKRVHDDDLVVNLGRGNNVEAVLLTGPFNLALQPHDRRPCLDRVR
jgi:hypothetical protein